MIAFLSFYTKSEKYYFIIKKYKFNKKINYLFTNYIHLFHLHILLLLYYMIRIHSDKGGALWGRRLYFLK